MSQQGNILFLVSANSKIGFGHLKRCILIASEFSKHASEIHFLLFDLENDNALNILTEEGYQASVLKNPFELQNLVGSLNEFYSGKNDLLIIDTDHPYFYKEGVQKAIIDLNFRLMHITLFNQYHYYSNYILNPNIMALSQEFSTEPYTKKFLGPEFFILDNSFKEITPKKVATEHPNLLITFGSADPADVTSKILEVLENNIDQVGKIRIVVGKLNERYEDICSHWLVLKYPERFELYYDTKDMYHLMKLTDLAISSLGLTFWELVLHKIPSIVVSGSEREKYVLEYFKELNYCFFLGHYNDKNWKMEWNHRLNLYFDQTNTIDLEQLYDTVNINGKTQLVDLLVNDYE